MIGTRTRGAAGRTRFPYRAPASTRIRAGSISAMFMCAALLGACAAPSLRYNARAESEVAATERAFARTMADRDFAAFQTSLAEDAIFFSGPAALHGKQRVAEAWQRFFEKSTAPFSWHPEQVQVLESGELALSSGPVRDPSGKLIATFTFIWRQEAPGKWRVVFNKGAEVCDCAKP